jgi:hypothetical protein
MANVLPKRSSKTLLKAFGFFRSRRNLPLAICVFVVLALFFSTMQNSFFWDTVQLGSKHASFYFEADFASLLLPENIDSGHIPFFGMYIALAWKIFGRSLLVSHLAMLPFVLGIVWQLYRVSNLFQIRFPALAVLLVALDPTLLAQITLVSPDVVFIHF